ncbi:3-oxoacyl-reductase [Diaporthe amygdali]|uniref:3-oxoacyl-reductase n=1 Tax=Phomopsis amygdali TaxID=1214568 RepID=UPI0022FECFE4|nr:3-oxoacyl-reductase [Diaporthe amygdali]KAJ0124480.1 3-oxoacyl-reductase [Diaporthe amygdali]
MAPLLRGTAFITGAAKGIGQATAAAFARHGVSRLAIADIDMHGLEKTKELLHAQCPDIKVMELQLDVRHSAQVAGALSEVMKKFGRLDIAVNNAGIGGSGKRTHEMPDDEWQQVADVDLFGVWRCQKEELAMMVDQEDLGIREGRGRIINVSSMYGLKATGPHLPSTPYVASKHGVIGLTRADANSYGHMNIRINAVCPGYVKTPLLDNLNIPSDSYLGRDLERTALKRLGLIEEVTDAIVFLASPMSSYMQGSALVVDGGYTSQ